MYGFNSTVYRGVYGLQHYIQAVRFTDNRETPWGLAIYKPATVFVTEVLTCNRTYRNVNVTRSTNRSLDATLRDGGRSECWGKSMARDQNYG